MNNTNKRNEAHSQGRKAAIADLNRLLHEKGTSIEEYFESLDHSLLASMSGEEIEAYLRGRD